MIRTVQVITLGCSKNTVDTEHLLAALPPDRFRVIPEGEDAAVDYLLVNTCGFIGDAKEESVNAVLAAGQRRRDGLAGKLFVFGCLSQRYADSLPPDTFEKAQAALGDTARCEEDVLSYITFPQVAEDFFARRSAAEERRVRYSIEKL